MASPEYENALRQGQKEYRNCVAHGIYPYLPALDDFITHEQLLNGSVIGLKSIPLDFVVGTKSNTRGNSFARNFMPLLNGNSEFAIKWSELARSQIEEGIREPIQVYEYMNRYYVVEGNKRVSVLKFFDAVSIPAEVTRIMPEPDDNLNVRLYMELVGFERLSGISFVELSKPGSFVRLQQLVGKEPNEEWTESDKESFTSIYYYFKRAFLTFTRESEILTAGDALITFLEVYGYDSLKDAGENEIKSMLAKIWPEIHLHTVQDPIEIKLDAQPDKKSNIISKIFNSSDKTIHIAFIHDKNPATSGWTCGHDIGIKHVEEVFKSQIEVASYYDAMDGDPMGVIDKAIAEGARVLFLTSPRFMPSALRAAAEHPEVMIYDCALNSSHRLIRTYTARMFEAKFIIGAIAGSLAGNNSVGYICDYPIYGQIAGINAFAQGVQMVNPRIRVVLDWSSVNGVQNAQKRLMDQGIRLISTQDTSKRDIVSRSDFGLAIFAEGNEINLAQPLWNWGTYYEKLVRMIKSHLAQDDYAETQRALNYYWGMSSGVIDVECTDQVPDGSCKLADILKKSICNGTCHPLCGPLYTQDGRIIHEDGKILSMNEIIKMDYLLENISGSIPPYEILTDVGKDTVNQIGIDSIPKN